VKTGRVAGAEAAIAVAEAVGVVTAVAEVANLAATVAIAEIVAIAAIGIPIDGFPQTSVQIEAFLRRVVIVETWSGPGFFVGHHEGISLT
jgi:hypothetical protein